MKWTSVVGSGVLAAMMAAQPALAEEIPAAAEAYQEQQQQREAEMAQHQEQQQQRQAEMEQRMNQQSSQMGGAGSRPSFGGAGMGPRH